MKAESGGLIPAPTTARVRFGDLGNTLALAINLKRKMTPFHDSVRFGHLGSSFLICL